MKKFLIGVMVATSVLALAQPIYAMPSYGFGGNGESGSYHVEQIKNNTAPNKISNTSDQDVIYFDIGSTTFIQQDIPKNSERIGTLTIPNGNKIGVFGGESMKSMDKGAGHFSNTGLNYSNTALIGHNRGPAGFFIFVKDLQIGQKLTLEGNGVNKKYVVTEMHKIHASDTELLMHFSDSRLTLVTCWENERDYRRVVVCYEAN